MTKLYSIHSNQHVKLAKDIVVYSCCEKTDTEQKNLLSWDHNQHHNHLTLVLH